MATSATLNLMGNKHASLFLGQWAPTLLILRVYTKLVKQLGSDSRDTPSSVTASATAHCVVGPSPIFGTWYVVHHTRLGPSLVFGTTGLVACKS